MYWAAAALLTRVLGISRDRQTDRQTAGLTTTTTTPKLPKYGEAESEAAAGGGQWSTKAQLVVGKVS